MKARVYVELNIELSIPAPERSALAIAEDDRLSVSESKALMRAVRKKLSAVGRHILVGAQLTDIDGQECDAQPYL